MVRRFYNSQVAPSSDDKAGNESKENEEKEPDQKKLPERKSKWSDPIYHFVKVSYFNLSCVFIPARVLPGLLFKKSSVNNTLVPAKMMTNVSKTLNWTWEMIGLEKLKPYLETSAVIMVNHQTTLDILGLFELWPYVGKMTVVAKHTLLLVPFFGILALKCGIIFINRDKKREAYNIIEAAVEECKKTGTKLLIFPEGKVCDERDGNLLPFKKGAFYAAIASQVPIIPIVFSEMKFLDRYRRKFYPGHTTIQILDPVSTEGLKKENTDELMADVRNRMVTVFKSGQSDPI